MTISQSLLLGMSPGCAVPKRSVPAPQPPSAGAAVLQVRKQTFVLQADAITRAGDDSLIGMLRRNPHAFAPATCANKTQITGVSAKRFHLVARFLTHQCLPATLTPKAAEQLQADAAYLQLDALVHELACFYPLRQAAVQAGSDARRVDAALQLGNALFADGAWQQALAIWRAADLETCTQDDVCADILGHIESSEAGSKEQAMWHYHAAMMVHPRLPLQARQRHCQTAASQFPNLFVTHALHAFFAVVLEGGAQAAEALRASEAALAPFCALKSRHDDGAAAATSVQQYHWRQQVLQHAHELLGEPLIGSLAFCSGALEGGAPQQALQGLQQVARMQQHDWLAGFAVGRAFVYLDKPKAAGRRFRRAAIKSGNHPSALFELAMLYQDSGDRTYAQYLLRGAVEQPAFFCPAWNAYGRLLGASGEPQKARALLQEALERRPDAPDVMVALAVVSDDAEAHRLLGRVTQIDPRNGEAWHEWGFRYFLRGDSQQTIDKLQRAWSLGVATGPTLYALGESYRLNKQPHLALRFLQKALCKVPESTLVRGSLAALHIAHGRWYKASSLLQAVPPPADETHFYLQQRLHMLRHDELYEEAVALGETLLQYLPDTSDILFDLAVSLQGLSRFAEAEAMIHAGIAAHPEEERFSRCLVYTLAKQARFDEALSTGKQALLRHPASAELYALHGGTYLLMQDPAGAQRFLQIAVTLNGKNEKYREVLLRCRRWLASEADLEGTKGARGTPEARQMCARAYTKNFHEAVAVAR